MRAGPAAAGALSRSSCGLLAAACFALALGLPFGHATRAGPSAPAILLPPRRVQAVVAAMLSKHEPGAATLERVATPA